MKKYTEAEPTCIRDVALSPSASFAKIRKYSNDLAVTFMTDILLDLVDFFSVGKSMGGKQIEATVKLLLQEYYYLKPEDFKLCFARVKRGVYGQVYDRLDGQVICGWLNEYCSERSDYFETKSENDHKEFMKQDKPENYTALKSLYVELLQNLRADINREDEYQTFKRNYQNQNTPPCSDSTQNI